MYLVKAITGGEGLGADKLSGGGIAKLAGNGLAGRVLRWLRRKYLADRRRHARKQLWLIESLTLGPKQRVVLLRCGEALFLVGTGAEGIQSIVPVGASSTDAELALVHALHGPCA